MQLHRDGRLPPPRGLVGGLSCSSGGRGEERRVTQSLVRIQEDRGLSGLIAHALGGWQTKEEPPVTRSPLRI